MRKIGSKKTMKTAILSLLIAMVTQAVQADVRIGLRPIFRHSDYGYEDGDWYGERQVYVQTVEIFHSLPGNVTGWQYVGVIRTEENANYETGNTDKAIWWGSLNSNGDAKTEEEAVVEIMRCSGYKQVPGKNNVFRRTLLHREKIHAVKTRNRQDRSVDR